MISSSLLKKGWKRKESLLIKWVWRNILNSNIFHRKIKLPFDITHPPLDVPNKDRACELSPYQLIDEKLLHLIDSCQAYPTHTEYFTFPPRGFVSVHLDDGIYSNRAKLNVFIGTGRMKWFEPLPAFKNKKIEISDIGSPYMLFTEDEVELVHENQMYGSYIINPGIPHRFINNSLHDCWVVSLVLFDKNTRSFLLFEDAIERFKEYIEEPR